MPLNLQTPTPLDYFAALVASDDGLPLLEAAASLAQDEYPDLDVMQVLADVDALAERVKRSVGAGRPPEQRLVILQRLFFRDWRFGGNVNHYHDPDNSFIHVLLRTRRGIPVSLAVLWLELAQAIGLDAQGVGFPGHFLVKVPLPTGLVVIDPFNGQMLRREDLSERLAAFGFAVVANRVDGPGDAAQTSPSRGPADIPVERYLQTASGRDIIARMLRNLKEIHHSQQDWPRLIAVQNRLIALLPEAWDEWRDRGLAYAQLGHSLPALRDLDVFLRHSPDGSSERAAVALRTRELRGGG